MVVPEDSVEASIPCQVSKTLALTMYREEEAFKIIVGAEGARPVWGFTEATFGFHVHHLSQLYLNLSNVSYHFSCTIWNSKVDLSDCGFENNPYPMTFTSNGANQAIFGGIAAPSPVELGSVKTEIISSY